jgi:hypothetical protein
MMRRRTENGFSLNPHRLPGRVQRFDEPVASLTASMQHFYWHWLFDVLPRFELYEGSPERPRRIYT